MSEIPAASQETDNCEAFAFRGIRQIAIGSDEHSATWAIAAPDQGCTQLKCISRPKRVATQLSLGPMPYLFGWLDFIP